MSSLSFDFSSEVGRIKPMHAVGQPPMYGTDTAYMHYLREAHIPYSRLHDVGGMYGCGVFVDIPNLFRVFDADETDPANYDFVFTDHLIKALFDAGCEPVFRLGVTIENDQALKAYRLDPPKDFGKWARICEHVIRHYNEGFANGFHYGIRFWEIWNEPDFAPEISANQMWHGTDEQFFELYDVAAKHLKTVFGDGIKVGGYASCGFYHVAGDPKAFGLDMERAPGDDNYLHHPVNVHRTDFFDRFIPYIAEHGSPLDFFSFHSYGDLAVTEIMVAYARKKLAEIGKGDVMLILDEWNNAFMREQRGTSLASAKAASMMLDMQNRPVDMLCYYDARIDVSRYGGLFNPMTCLPVSTYYAFKAFGELYTLGTQVSCVGEEPYRLYAVAAKNEDGRRAAMVCNVTGEDMTVKTDLSGDFTVYLANAERFLTPSDLDPARLTLPAYTVALIADYKV